MRAKGTGMEKVKGVEPEGGHGQRFAGPVGFVDRGVSRQGT